MGFMTALAGCGDTVVTSYVLPEEEPEEPPTLLHSREAVGEPCQGTADGWADIRGAAEELAFMEIQHSVFVNQSDEAAIVIGEDAHARAQGYCDPREGDVYLELHLAQDLIKLDKIPVSERISIMIFSFTATGQHVSKVAISGSITLKGFDPKSASLCGELEAEFGDGGRISGPFESRSYCRL